MADDTVTFEYGYPDWESAARAATGYDYDIIIDKVVNSARAVRDGRSAYERDTLLFDQIEYAWPVLASLMLAAANCSRLNILDFGGSLGSTRRQTRVFFDVLSVPKQWNIVEQEKLVQIGRREFETGDLRFYHSINECADQCEIDVVLFLSSLQYMPKPYEILKEILALSPKYVIIDRTPVRNAEGDAIAVQRVKPPVYSGSFPTHIFNQKNLTDVFAKDFVSLERWRCPGQPDPMSSSKGYVFKRHSAE